MKCINTRAKLIIQQLYESMFHEPYIQTEYMLSNISTNVNCHQYITLRRIAHRLYSFLHFQYLLPFDEYRLHLL